MVTRSAGPRRRRRRRRRLAVGVGVGRLGAGLSGLARCRSPTRPGSSGRDRRERLGERVGQVAEDVGRVVELDQLVGAAERPPLVLGVLGDDLGLEAVGRQRQPLVVVVDDDQVADDRDQAGRGALELLEQARLAALAALLVLERQVVQPARGRLVVVLGQRDRLAGGPRIGGGGVRVLATARRPRRARSRRPRAGRPRRSARRASRPPRGRPRRTRRRCRPGCRARPARRRTR